MTTLVPPEALARTMSESEYEWSPDSAPDVAGQTVVVTGANSGIGYEATRAFAEGGARVVMACRSTDRGEDAAAEIRAENPPGELAVRQLDLAALSSVRSFAGGFEGDLDLLVNNAGVMGIPYSETGDGFETQFGVNHLGHFALTGLLLDSLLAGEGHGRVVTVSSDLHKQGSIDPGEVKTGIGRVEYDRWVAYARSKLANLLFAFELQRRLAAADADAISLGVHPGYADTNLQRRAPEMMGSTVWLYFMKVANLVMAQSAERGAWPIRYAATHPDLAGGEYVGPVGILEMRGSPGVADPAKKARDEDLARRLWTVSEELTGVTVDLPDPRAGSGDDEGDEKDRQEESDAE